MTAAEPRPHVPDLMSKLVSLAKRRGFIFPSSAIYGGLSSSWDYGPLGVELKKNIKEHWWRAMVYDRDDIEGLDTAILMHPRVWHASGHVEAFTDPLVDCLVCKRRFREDELADGKCPECGGDASAARDFNLMLETHLGPVRDDASLAYLRPETCQGIYVNFLNVIQSARQKIPFGIAQIGKAFRNEVTPGNFTFRSREFEQMEMQFFVRPGTDETWFEYWKQRRMEWYPELGIDVSRLRFRRHASDELAHYAKQAPEQQFDIEYFFPIGWKECEGIHHRTDFDLTRHTQHSGEALSTFDDETQTRYVPYIIETSAGADRTTLVALIDAYDEETVRGGERTVLRFHPALAPIKAGVFPVVKRQGMPEKARGVYEGLRRRFRVFYDEGGSIGRRYRRMDEAGTPFGITVDGQTVEDDTVTVRDRDTMVQDRVPIAGLTDYLDERIGAWSRSEPRAA